MKKHYMQPRNRLPRSKRCHGCGKQVLIAGYDRHVEKCHATNRPHSSSGSPSEVKKSSAKDFGQIMSRHGIRSPEISKRDISIMNRVLVHTDDLIACKYCDERIPQKKYIKHSSHCAKTLRSCGSPNKEAHFRAGNTVKFDQPSPLKRQTPFELSQSRSFKAKHPQGQNVNEIKNTQELLKENPFIKKTILLNDDEEEECPSRTGTEFVDLLEQKIGDLESKLSPKTKFQHAVRNKILPFHLNVDKRPKKLLKCEHCNRTFRPEAFEKHSNICLRVFVGKRPFYDSSRARLRGTPMEFFYWKSRRTTSGQGSRRPRSAPKTRRVLSSTDSRNDHTQPPVRSSTAPVGRRRYRKKHNKKNLGLFSLRLNLFELPEPIMPSSGGCRVRNGTNWRLRSRHFREAITAARVAYYTNKCMNQYKL